MRTPARRGLLGGLSFPGQFSRVCSRNIHFFRHDHRTIIPHNTDMKTLWLLYALHDVGWLGRSSPASTAVSLPMAIAESVSRQAEQGSIHIYRDLIIYYFSSDFFSRIIDLTGFLLSCPSPGDFEALNI